jgi:hypothetical protein
MGSAKRAKINKSLTLPAGITAKRWVVQGEMKVKGDF